ncbi:MAG: hypothetical protein KJ621_13770 [Proteobacteria bacterium]|nr:hypothetical protein [Pseudomonadota bacterium]
MSTIRRLLSRPGLIALAVVLGLTLAFSVVALSHAAEAAKPAAATKAPAKPAASGGEGGGSKGLNAFLLGPVKTFVAGWLLLIALVFFAVGSITRLIVFLSNSRKRDKFLWSNFSWKYVLATWFRYLIPWNQTVRKTPVFSLAMYLFHICIIGLALFVGAHLTGWKNGFLGINLTFLELGDWTVRIMTYLTFLLFLYLIARRIIDSAVRKLSTAWDFTLLIILLVPFISGYLLFDFPEASWMMGEEGETLFRQYLVLIHLLFANLVLFLIPLTKMAHWLLFFPSRALIGIEWGRRGYVA